MDNDPNSPQVLANVPTDAEAAIIIAHLAEIGINAQTSGSGGATGWPEAGGFTQVVVRQADFERAQKEIERIEDENS